MWCYSLRQCWQGTWTYSFQWVDIRECICDKVKPIDEARDKKMMESGFIEAFTEILARAEAEASWPKQCPLVKRCTILRRARSVSNVTNTTINPCSSVQAGRFLRLRPTSSHWRRCIERSMFVLGQALQARIPMVVMSCPCILVKSWLSGKFGASNSDCRGRFSEDDWQKIDIVSWK